LTFSLNLRAESALEGKDIRDDVRSASVAPHEVKALSALFHSDPGSSGAVGYTAQVAQRRMTTATCLRGAELAAGHRI
jgi:hypothetical protein